MKHTSKIDGRHSGNSAMAVLSRLAGEVAYAQKRLCLRDEIKVLTHLEKCANEIEKAMLHLEAAE